MAYTEDDVDALADAVEEELERRRRIHGQNEIAVKTKQRGWLMSLIKTVCDWLFGGWVSWLVNKVMGIFGF